MPNNIFKWLKEIAPRSLNFFSFSRHDPTISSVEDSLESINRKIFELSGKKLKSIDFEDYKNYFSILKSLGLWKDFEINTSKDNLLIKGTVIDSPLINPNNRKTIIFCHGITNNRWSLFYCIHLVLQMGYQVVIYDARNHGMSQSSYNTLGKEESSDLEDIVNWVNKKYHPLKIGFYGFSMGSATLLFLIGKFQNIHPEVSFVICEAPLDDFNKRFQGLLNSSNSSETFEELKDNEDSKSWKYYFFHKLLMKILNSPVDLSEIKPILALPKKLKLKLLLLHGFEDTVISWQSSLNIWETLNKEKENSEFINLYLFDYADHNEVPFLGDYLPNSLHSIKRNKRPSKFCFSSLLFSFLYKNF